MEMDESVVSACASASPYELLFKALYLIPLSHYCLFALLNGLIFLYNFLEIHFLGDFFAGFRGDPVHLTYNASSKLYQSVASKCHVLHGRFHSTPWLSSPHLQTAFLSLYEKSPDVTFKRQIIHAPDGGTIALDWLAYNDVIEGFAHVNESILKCDKTPIMVVVPGLTSDSSAAYIKHLAFKVARRGWNVCISNHRGLGGVPLTADRFYNGGWTGDIRVVIDHIHYQYPEAPLYAVGTSIGANVLVKYLGEDGVKTPIVGAAAICSPWDFLICDRFINRNFSQKVYDRALAGGLRDYAQLHQSFFARLGNWEGITKSSSLRHFDKSATCLLGKFETVDDYYRYATSTTFVKNISVPLLCISALDDPVCTREAIPWEECRANENIILATTEHGGHLAYYEGMTASSLWWVRAVDEFLDALHNSPYLNRAKKVQESSLPAQVESLTDQRSYVKVAEDGMVATVGTVASNRVVVDALNDPVAQIKKPEDANLETEKSNPTTEETTLPGNDDLIVPIRRRIDRLIRHSRMTIWLLACLAFTSTWPLVGSAFMFFFRRKFKSSLTGS